MAMRKPLLTSADPGSELSTVISNANCGLVSAPHDSASLLRNLASLREDAGLREALGERGYQHVKAYDRERVLSKFLARIFRWNSHVGS